MGYTDYMTAKEAARRWRVSDRQVQRLLSAGRIIGAQKFGVSWLIPADAEKPPDPRTVQKRGDGAAGYVFLVAADLPRGCTSVDLSGLPPSARALAAADLAFRRGDAAPAKAVWRATPAEEETKLSAASLATAAAISSGDYALYHEIQQYIRAQAAKTKGPRDLALLSLPAALTAVSMAVPDMTPGWLKACDFSLFPHTLRPFLLFLYAMHLRNIGAYAEMLGVARATRLLTEKEGSFTWLDVYLGVLCASAAYALGDEPLAREALAGALALAAPCGMIAPFADHLGTLGGLVEAALKERYPAQERPVVELWRTSFMHWMGFHNVYAREHITTVLTPQEYHVAKLLSGGATNAEAARRLHLSPGRVKNIASAVYRKLQIEGRQDLGAFIL